MFGAAVISSADEVIFEAFSLGFPASYRYVPAAHDLTMTKDEFEHLPLQLHMEA